MEKMSLPQQIIKKTTDILKSGLFPYQPKKTVFLKDFKDDKLNSIIPMCDEKINSLKVISQKEIEELKNSKQIVTVIDNYVYNVTSWEKKHPGGSAILHEYNGIDSSDQFFAFHRPHVVKMLDTYIIGKVEQQKTLKKEDILYKKLRNYLWKNDYFDYSQQYYDQKYLWLVILFIGSLLLTLNQNYILGAILLAQFIKQSAFIAHDSCHYGILPQKPGRGKNLHGMFFGSVIFGISTDMWNEEHTMHHAITRRPMTDPQFKYLPFFMISPKEITWFGWKLDFFTRFLVSIQHYTYVPLAMLVGRFNLYIISIISIIKHQQFLNIIGMLFYALWYIPFVSLVEGKQEKIIFVLLNHFTVGILHIQLLISHLAVEAYTPEEERELGFFRFQLQTTRNIITSWWNDWFHGGLQKQIEHHLFPELPRHNLQLIVPVCKEICNECDIPYLEDPFWKCMDICTSDMKRLATMVASGEL